MHYHFRRHHPIFMCLLALLLVAACTPTAAPASKPTSVLRLGTVEWVGSAPLYIAEAKGFFKEAGLEVALTIYKSQSEAVQTFVEKRTDLVTCTISDVLGVVASIGERGQIIWVLDSSAGGDVVVGSPTITSPADLKGKRVGLVYGTFSHLFVVAGLENAGLKESDIQIVNLNEVEVIDALKAGTIDAGHTWNPHLAKALSDGGKVVFTSADTPSVIVNTVFADTVMLKERPEDLQTLIKVIQRANQWWTENAVEGNEIVAKRLGMTPGDVVDTLTGIKRFGINENAEAFREDEADSLVKAGNFVSAFLFDKSIIKQKPDISRYLNATFVNALSAAN